MKVKILAHTPNPEKVVAMAGKLCYSPSSVDELEENLTDEEIQKFIDKFMGYGHESPLEHISFVFAVEGVSRSLTHQLVRHRIASYSQKSQRYVNEDNFEYVVPQIVRDMGTQAWLDYTSDMKQINEMYTRWQKRIKDFVEETNYPTYGMSAEKVANENARSVLPNACETKIIITMNVRSLYNFFNKRCCNRAQQEIRELANEMLRQVREVAPSLFKNVGASCTYGKCKEGKMTCGSPIGGNNE